MDLIESIPYCLKLSMAKILKLELFRHIAYLYKNNHYERINIYNWHHPNYWVDFWIRGVSCCRLSNSPFIDHWCHYDYCKPIQREEVRLIPTDIQIFPNRYVDCFNA